MFLLAPLSAALTVTPLSGLTVGGFSESRVLSRRLCSTALHVVSTSMLQLALHVLNAASILACVVLVS